ncbi:major facilitator superfamily domain-containing protein [Apodospora peruviana]|uniref:Major facilitator superfamily domain-containing protein n=1 Tax=Apodospora peruviana TaxID=516989 RepID=A0AAE0I6R3_9PEZI|nr:major facilitator superfamily domain-containing protein [Apodospora peruviana]
MANPQQVERHPVTWYRSTVFASFMVAGTAFTCPGIFGALNGMGAGGGASPDVSNAANAIVFGIIAIGSLFVGAICNHISPKWTLLIGCLGYAPYAAGLYLVDQYKVEWLLLLGAVTCGLSACFLWVASGAVFLGYTEENRKGFATSLKFSCQNLGASIGGIISLSLNISRSYRGSISKSTYITLMTIMCLGAPFAFLLPSTRKVQRTDGRAVVITKAPSLLSEFRVLGSLLKNPTVLALMPLMLYAQWFLSYQWQFNYAYFTVRSRALNSMMFYLGGLIASMSLGWFLDWDRLPRPKRAKIGFLIMLVTSGSSWIIGQVVQARYWTTKPTLDWDGDGFGLGCFLFMLWGVSDPLVTTYKYWIAGTLTNNVNEATFLAALINSVGAVGSTFGFVVSAMKTNYNGACAINTALFFLAMPGVAWVAFTRISETSHGTSLTGLVDGEKDGSSVEEVKRETDVESRDEKAVMVVGEREKGVLG